MSEEATTSREPGYSRPAVAWYLVFVLLAIYIISFVDRQILSLLVKPIREAIEIDDKYVGLLMGFGFAFFYAIFGIPLGWVADRFNRVALIGIGLVLWSLMTVGCGFATGFSSLLFFRFGVGIGEATLSPAAYSMIADSFPPRRLASAISVYSMAVYIGSGLAMIFGGLIVKYAMTASVSELPLVGVVKPWQLVFFVVGLAGLPLVLLLFTVREPARHKSSMHTTLAQTFEYIQTHVAAFLLHSAGFGFLAMVGYANMYWIPTFFDRIHHWTTAETAFRYGVMILITGTLGIVCGGALGDYLRGRGYSDGSMRTCLLSALLALPFAVLYPLVPNAMVGLALSGGLTFATSLASGVAPTVMQQMMPPAMRGQASALYLFIVNMIGIGVGPYAVGVLNAAVVGDDHIHQSLVVVGATGCVLAAGLLVMGLAPFRRASAEVEALAQRAAGI